MSSSVARVRDLQRAKQRRYYQTKRDGKAVVELRVDLLDAQEFLAELGIPVPAERGAIGAGFTALMELWQLGLLRVTRSSEPM